MNSPIFTVIESDPMGLGGLALYMNERGRLFRESLAWKNSFLLLGARGWGKFIIGRSLHILLQPISRDKVGE